MSFSDSIENMIHFFILFWTVLVVPLCAEHSDEVWAHVHPYLMTEDHPIKAKMDAIFSKARVTLNAETMNAAGFTNSKAGKWSNTVVTRHPKIPGYILKLYRDDQAGFIDWHMCYRRCLGAQCIQETIDLMGYQKMFVVPKKWIYCIPNSSPEGKCFILVAEDLKILKRKENYAKWRSPAMSFERLEAIFLMVKSLGLSDSTVPFNIPFCKDGRNAFIDTEWHHAPYINYERLLIFLSPRGVAFWKTLIEKL